MTPDISIDEKVNELYENLRAGNFDTSLEIAKQTLRSKYDLDLIQKLIKFIIFWKKVFTSVDEIDGRILKVYYIVKKWIEFIKFNFLACDECAQGYDSIKYYISQYSLSILLDYKKNFYNHEKNLNFFIGRFYKMIGDYEKSYPILLQCYNEDKKSAKICAEFADCNGLIGNTKVAKILFQEAFFLDPKNIEIEFIETKYIKSLEEILIKDYNINYDCINLWFPIYAKIYKIFSIRRELKSLELDFLKKKIVYLEKSDSSDRIPQLINCYLRYIDHQIAKGNGVDKENIVNGLLEKIKLVDKNIYSELIQ